MSARQPFLPSRPASRAVNPGDDAIIPSDNAAHAGLANPSSTTEGNHLELGVEYLSIHRQLPRGQPPG